MEEFSQLLRCHGDLVYRMALHITGGREEEARDLFQEGFLKVWRHWDRQRPTHFKRWMYCLLRNLYIDVVRRKVNQPTLSLDEPDPTSETTLAQQLPDHQPPIDAGLERRDVQSDVLRALAKLDIEFRLPVILCDMEGLSYEEIATIMSCPIGTVRSRIHRGHLQLKRLLRHHMMDPRRLSLSPQVPSKRYREREVAI